MHLAGIGDLIAHGEFWRLTYDRCGHTQEFPWPRRSRSTRPT